MEEFYCVSCSEIVTTRQEALLCNGCERWQHRRCGTAITRETYRRAVREGVEIPWKCLFCKDEEPLPIAESTMIDTDQSPVELPEPMEESSIEDPSILNLETNFLIR
ncbi:hypothetical protein P5673_020829 [Acropora cervicornis]|uniref:PHD-type domain-containing protein n=1 Tax=Acropora cervicornis TaxID=6130 RepID=A0AAD9V0P6_ACRCE|nr:hypothetical protein P5673_020829 [Acropora cervicornis]